MAREFTNKILQMNEDGLFHQDQLIRDLLCWMSEDDVKAFYQRYVFLYEEGEKV